MDTNTKDRAPNAGESWASRSSILLPLFAVSAFLSAFLLFQVQLIVNKHILPWFGGSAAVWTCSMLVFQVLLLAGYVYSHLITTALPIRRQFTLHALLLAAAILAVIVLSAAWPSAITPGVAWKPSQSDHPITEVSLIILVATGLPFFVLSTSAPLLQSWLSRLGYGTRAYRLYALSNLGSLLGLLSFPFVLEPLLRSKIHGQLWALSFCLFAVASLLCGRQAAKHGSPILSALPNEVHWNSETFRRGRISWLLWFLLAACASSLLLATTNLLCQEVITVPLLWVLPLSIYLISFVLCFDHPRWYQRAVFHPLFFIALFLTCAALHSNRSSSPRLLVPLVLLFAACMICHGELVRLRPEVRDLTAFYLAISAGGATGGIFVALVAPQLFTSFAEFEASLAVAVLLLITTLYLDRRSWIYSRNFLLSGAIISAAIVLAYATGVWLTEVSAVLNAIKFYPIALLIGILVVMGALIFERSPAQEGMPFRFVQILVLAGSLGAFVALYFSALPDRGVEFRTRDFYGVIRVFHNLNATWLVHGQTTHGAQLDPPNQLFPVTYYGPNSGVGVVLRNHPNRSNWNSSLRIGVVGLGAGTLAAYGRPGDSIRFYELDPAVIRLSSGERPTFTYVRDSSASITHVLGDARLSLEREEAEGKTQQFDVLVLDAFSGDAIPVHLLTKEAFETYWKQLAADKGIIAVHITSRHVNLVPVLLGATQYFHANSRMTFSRGQGPIYDSGWFLMSKSPEALDISGLVPITVQYVHNVGPRLWTDDRSDIIRLIY